MELLQLIDDESGGAEKTIIFSQFTSMLDLLEPFLKHGGINYVRCMSLFFVHILEFKVL